ncbi:hypothetical protein [Leisingera aquaemixtae]|uniref:hypothetical protein n=1 Tax=Leisingera aquaemixtae TaxID=1396826 RepID=UPI0011AE2A7F|nr:hypothetical protein [Leisingera aquaemixtae]
MAELAQHQHRVDADKRRKRDFEHRRNERDRKEEIEDKAEAAIGAMAAVAFSPPATVQQIAAFEADLTLYDTATVDALMANDLQMEKLRADLETLLSQAFVMEDGRRVFRTEDGTQVFDEFGEDVGPGEIDPATIPDHHPTWEEFSALKDQYATLQQEREALIEYQKQLDAARDALAEGEITQDELEELRAELIEDTPEAVRARLPQEHQAVQFDGDRNSVEVAAKPVSGGPSLDGLKGFVVPEPNGA